MMSLELKPPGVGPTRLVEPSLADSCSDEHGEVVLCGDLIGTVRSAILCLPFAAKMPVWSF